MRLLEACGRRCYRRHAFKREIARKGKGSLANLERPYNESFEAWIEGGALHIRYGVEILETVRSGGTTCHFAVRPA